MLGVLQRLSYELRNLQLVIQYHSTFIRPIIEYNIFIWYTTGSKHTKIIKNMWQNVLKCAIRSPLRPIFRGYIDYPTRCEMLQFISRELRIDLPSAMFIIRALRQTAAPMTRRYIHNMKYSSVRNLRIAVTFVRINPRAPITPIENATLNFNKYPHRVNLDNTLDHWRNN